MQHSMKDKRIIAFMIQLPLILGGLETINMQIFHRPTLSEIGGVLTLSCIQCIVLHFLFGWEEDIEVKKDNQHIFGILIIVLVGIEVLIYSIMSIIYRDSPSKLLDPSMLETIISLTFILTLLVYSMIYPDELMCKHPSDSTL